MFVRTPCSHTHDPESSHDAEKRMNKSGKRKRNQDKVYELVNRLPGATAAELARDGNMDAVEVRRRLSDMKDIMVYQGQCKQKCGVKGTLAVTWFAK